MSRPPLSPSTLRRRFAGVSAVYLVGIPLSLLANIILARALTSSSFGHYSFALSATTVIAIPVAGGVPTLLTREVARCHQAARYGAWRGVTQFAHRWVYRVSGMVAVAAIAAELLIRKRVTSTTLACIALIPSMGLVGIYAGTLRGLGRPVAAELPKQALAPLILALSFGLVSYTGQASTAKALWLYSAATLVAAVALGHALRASRPTEYFTATPSVEEMGTWRRALLPFSLVSAATVVGTQLPVLLTGLFSQPEATAQIRIAERFAMLAGFPLLLINSAIGPYIVDAVASDDPRRLKAIARQSARITSVAAAPIALALVLLGPTLLRHTFGEPYDTSSYVPMAVLVAGQLCSVLLGNSGQILAMSGHERHTAIAMGIAIAVTISLGPTLIPKHGALGAAVAASTGTISAKLYTWLVVKRTFGVSSGIL